MRFLRSFRFFALVLVVGIVLVVATAPAAPSAQSRISHLESLVKCPSCENLSVAQSNATSAVAVRNEIRRMVLAGSSDNSILTSLESTYGSSVLLSPPTSGLGSLLVIGPVALVLVLIASFIRLSRRR